MAACSAGACPPLRRSLCFPSCPEAGHPTETPAVAMARERLATATRRREAVERLRDRAVRAARREADRREQLKLDEIGALGHVAVADGPGGAR